MKEETRKITKVGGKCYSVVLPIDYVRKLGWKERQKVNLKLKGKTITISDWK